MAQSGNDVEEASILGDNSNEPLLEHGRDRMRRPVAVLVGCAFAAATICTAASFSVRAPRAASGVTRPTRLTIEPEDVEQKFSSWGMYCYQANPVDDCWVKKPPEDTPECTVDSGDTVCKCPEQEGSGCHVDALDANPPATGWCSSHLVFIYGGEEHNNVSTHAIDVLGSKDERFCMRMDKLDQWHDKHIARWPGDPEATSSSDYWSCWFGYTWEQGSCQRKTRYLGETCWDGNLLDPAGTCANSGSYYDEYTTSCRQGTCIPYSWVKDREECQCDWVGWNFIVACSAADGKCGGHACILHVSNGHKYCDYATKQNW